MAESSVPFQRLRHAASAAAISAASAALRSSPMRKSSATTSATRKSGKRSAISAIDREGMEVPLAATRRIGPRGQRRADRGAELFGQDHIEREFAARPAELS